jgi:hypothetical protein
MAWDHRAGCLRFVPWRRQCLYLRMIARHIFLCVEHECRLLCRLGSSRLRSMLRRRSNQLLC